MPFNISWTFTVDDPALALVAGIAFVAAGYVLYDLLSRFIKSRRFKRDIVAPPPMDGRGGKWYGKRRKITFYGDSIGHGGYVGPNGIPARLSPTPAERLAEMCDCEVDDRTQNGDTVKAIYERFFNDEHDGELTVIQASINDTIQGYRVSERLDHMIKHELIRGRKVIITGMSWTDRMDIHLYEKQTEEIVQLCNRHPMSSVLCADWRGTLFYGGDLDLLDNLHPSEPYSRRLMTNLYYQAEKLLSPK